MNKPTSFHVRHDLLPDLTYELLTLLYAAPSPQAQKDIKNAADVRGFQLRTRKDYGKLINSLIELEVLIEEDKRYVLSQIGQTIAHIVVYQRELLPDFIHFLYYISYDLNHNKRFSWSYRLVCDSLWNTAPCIINRDRLVNLVTQQAAETFNVNGISFSRSSVSGILNWLEKLTPQTILFRDKGQYFLRRNYCSLELFILALDFTFQQYHTQDEFYTPLSTEFRAQVCRICLLSTDAFSEMLDQAEASFNCIQIRRERGDRINIKDFSWLILEN